MSETRYIESDGDESSVECPLCGYDHCFQDWAYEGWEGQDDYDCEGCGAKLIVEISSYACFDVTMKATPPAEQTARIAELEAEVERLRESAKQTYREKMLVRPHHRLLADCRERRKELEARIDRALELLGPMIEAADYSRGCPGAFIGYSPSIKEINEIRAALTGEDE